MTIWSGNRNILPPRRRFQEVHRQWFSERYPGISWSLTQANIEVFILISLRNILFPIQRNVSQCISAFQRFSLIWRFWAQLDTRKPKCIFALHDARILQLPPNFHPDVHYGEIALSRVIYTVHFKSLSRMVIETCLIINAVTRKKEKYCNYAANRISAIEYKKQSAWSRLGSNHARKWWDFRF